MPSRPPVPRWIPLLALAIPLLFACVTHHIWEDYLITLRSSRNLVEGHGLVFNPGERVHTFTSPLGVLLPAACTWIAGLTHETAAVWLFRAFNAVLLALGAILASHRLRSLGIGSLGVALAIGLIIVDPKLVDFAMNGMETALMVVFVLGLWCELESPAGARAPVVGLWCGALMWTRPDGFMPAAALILAHLLVRRRDENVPWFSWRSLPKAAGIALMVYAPWLAFATWYYGSPIPNTIVAKSAISPHPSVLHFLTLPWEALNGQATLLDLFTPTYWFYGGWPDEVVWVARVLSSIAAFAWIFPRQPILTRRLSLAVFLGMFYFCSIIAFPWYEAPWMAMAALTVGCLADVVVRHAIAHQRRWLASLVRIGALTALAAQGAVLVATTWEMRIQQQIVEDGVRRPIGEWLHENAAPGDTVFLEPLGYIGYYSNLKMYDYPGLSSPEVVRVISSGARRFTDVINRLRPTWVVVRPFEIADATKPQNAVWRQYTLVRTWNARPQLDAVPVLPGRGWMEHDAAFLVFHYNPKPRDAARTGIALHGP